MTDTGQIPGEGLPENAGMVDQQGIPAPGVYTYPGPSAHVVEDDDMLFMPGVQGAWVDPSLQVPAHAAPPAQAQAQFQAQPVMSAVQTQHPYPGQQSQDTLGQDLFPTAPPAQAPAPVYAETGLTDYPDTVQAAAPAPVAEDPTVPAQGGPGGFPADTGTHESGGRDAGTVDHGEVRTQPLATVPTAARRPLHLGPQVPDTSGGGVVRSLADRGPAGAPAPAAPVPEPEPELYVEPQAFTAPEPAPVPVPQPAPDYYDAALEGTAVLPGPQLGEILTPHASPWTAPKPLPPIAGFVPVEGNLPDADHLAPTPVAAVPEPVAEPITPEAGTVGTPVTEPAAAEPDPQPEPEPQPEAVVEVEAPPAVVEADIVPEAPVQVPEAVAEVEPAPEPEPLPVAEAGVAEIQAEAVPVPETPVDQVEPETVPVVVEAAPEVQPAADAVVEAAPEPVLQQPAETLPPPEPEASPEPEPEALSDPEALPEPEPEPVTPEADAGVEQEAEPAVEAAEPDPVIPDALVPEAEPEAVAVVADEAQPVPDLQPDVADDVVSEAEPESEVAVVAGPEPEPQEAAETPLVPVAEAVSEAEPEPGLVFVPAPESEAEDRPEPEADVAVATPQLLPEAAPQAADSEEPATAEQAAPVFTAPAESTEPAAPVAPAETPEPAVLDKGPAPAYDDAERAAVLRVMRERRDIRNGFRSDPIPHDVLLRVLEAAHTAPSVGHSQPWDFVVIRSEETRRTMQELAQKQREAYALSLPKGRAKQFKEMKIEAILETPVNIVVTADPTRGGRHTLGRHTQPQMAPYSSALAVENLWLAARAEGLGVGWVSFFDEREMVQTLGLPEHFQVVAYLCVGYVDEFPEEPELTQAGWAKRRPLSWVVHEETYGRRALPGGEPHDLLQETLAGIRPLDAKALGEAWERQKRMTKPAGALGMLEIISAQLCGLSRVCPPPIPEPAAVAIFAGDHGVHAQGVTAWPQEVTTQMVANFLGGGAVCNAFANQVGAEVCVIDVGVAAELPAAPGLLPRKVRPGTGDITTGPAMTREEAVAAIEVGIETARDLVAAGNKALLTGEMGIANTTVSAALISVFTGDDPAEITGRGTGINDEIHAHKVDVVRRALELHQPDPTDPIGVLAAVGGLEHAAMVGLLLGGAALRTPVVLDGVSAGAAALVAREIAPEVLAACIAGHRSAEPGHVAALTRLGLRPLVDLDLRLGEGTGALLALPLIQSAARAMHEVATFDAVGITEK